MYTALKYFFRLSVGLMFVFGSLSCFSNDLSVRQAEKVLTEKYSDSGDHDVVMVSSNNDASSMRWYSSQYPKGHLPNRTWRSTIHGTNEIKLIEAGFLDLKFKKGIKNKHGICCWDSITFSVNDKMKPYFWKLGVIAGNNFAYFMTSELKKITVTNITNNDNSAQVYFELQYSSTPLGDLLGKQKEKTVRTQKMFTRYQHGWDL